MILLGLIWYLLHNSFFPLYKISNEILISCKMCFFNESFQFRHRKQTVHKQWWSFYCKRLYMPHTCNTYKAYMNLFFLAHSQASGNTFCAELMLHTQTRPYTEIHGQWAPICRNLHHTDHFTWDSTQNNITNNSEYDTV